MLQGTDLYCVGRIPVYLDAAPSLYCTDCQQLYHPIVPLSPPYKTVGTYTHRFQPRPYCLNPVVPVAIKIYVCILIVIVQCQFGMLLERQGEKHDKNTQYPPLKKQPKTWKGPALQDLLHGTRVHVYNCTSVLVPGYPDMTHIGYAYRVQLMTRSCDYAYPVG